MVGESRAQCLDRPQAVREQEGNPASSQSTPSVTPTAAVPALRQGDQDTRGRLDIGKVSEHRDSFAFSLWSSHSGPNRANVILS